jgi:hypothetical protein
MEIDRVSQEVKTEVLNIISLDSALQRLNIYDSVGSLVRRYSHAEVALEFILVT